MYILSKIKKLIIRIPAELYIFLFAVIYRLPTLGHDFINGDAYHWKERGYEFGSAIMSLNLKDTAVTYHPGATLLWSQFVANKTYSIFNRLYFHNSLDPKELFLFNHFLQKLSLVIITSVLITLVFHLLKRYLGKKAAILCVLLILLEPFYLALSRAIHTDVLLSLFMFVSLIYFYGSLRFPTKLESYTKKKKIILRWRDAVFTGVFMGLAMATKSSALFLGLFFFGITVFYSIKSKNSLYFKNFLVMVFSSFLIFAIVWPAVIAAPVSTLNSYLFQGIKGVALEEGHGHIWFGQETLNPGMSFYPVILIGRYSLVLIFLALGGLLYLLKNKNKLDPKLKGFLYINLIYFFAYLLMITVVSKKLDRYSLPLIFSLAVFATYYLDKILSKTILYSGVILFIIARFVLFLGIHPSYLAYYSPIIGGVEGGKNIIEPKWMVGYDKVAKYFNSKDKPESINVAIADYDYITPFAKFRVLNIQHEPERDQAQYFVMPVYREDRILFYESHYDLEKLNDTIKVAGVDYYYIYKVKGKY